MDNGRNAAQVASDALFSAALLVTVGWVVLAAWGRRVGAGSGFKMVAALLAIYLVAVALRTLRPAVFSRPRERDAWCPLLCCLAGACLVRFSLSGSIWPVALGAGLLLIVPWSRMPQRHPLLITATTTAGALAGWLLAPPASVPFALPAGLILWFLACAAILFDFAIRLGHRPPQRRSGSV